MPPDVSASVLGAVSCGGALGAAARYGLEEAWPPGPVPWATVAINVTGSALLGVLVVLAAEVFAHRPLLVPFLGTGVLGGYTTFSAYSVDAVTLVDSGRAGIAVAYLLGTLVAAVSAAACGMHLARRGVRSARRRRAGP